MTSSARNAQFGLVAVFAVLTLSLGVLAYNAADRQFGISGKSPSFTQAETVASLTLPPERP